MACFRNNERNTTRHDECMHMNVVSGATDDTTCGCGCTCCCVCNGCGNVGNTACNHCGPNYYVTNSDCDCEDTVEDTCCNSCNTCG